MSSNISIQKNCEFCGKTYTAKTLFTRYCSKQCNSRHYKQLAKEEKFKVHKAQEVISFSPIQTVNDALQEYFELHEAAQIMRISKRTLYRLIAENKIKKKKLLSRTIITREDIKSFFEQQ